MAEDTQLLGGGRTLRPQPRASSLWSIFPTIVVSTFFTVVIGRYFLIDIYRPTFPTYVPNYMVPHPDTSNCTLLWFDQRVDHFTTLNTTYKQRYYVYDKFWSRKSNGHEKDGPIFFYVGNEGDVTLYVNHTGLMWENAQEFGALIVFAEHRYYGRSMPFGDKYKDHLQYLTHEQALADYAFLLRSLQKQYGVDVPVIAFGGSYGGMLATWLRIKYPTTILGAIAASAPIFNNPFGYGDQFKGPDYWKAVTFDASTEAGADAQCIPNVRATWPLMFEKSSTPQGLSELSSIFKTCRPLKNLQDVESLALTLMMAWDTMAMGNFPYPSSYLTEGKANMPAFPVRVACSRIASAPDNNTGLLTAMKNATDIYNNATQSVVCTEVEQDYDGIWDYMWCSQLLGQESYYDSNGESDMFWSRNLTIEKISADCQAKWGVSPDTDLIRTEYGSPQSLLASTSNIVFSNGGFDPWSSGGVLSTSNPTITLVDIPEGAHHLDLMFSDPLDPSSVTHARRVEVQKMHEWLRVVE
ncbi:unnamed protein product [Aphanomyces euteiches]